MVSTAPYLSTDNEDIILANYIKDALEGKTMSQSDIKTMIAKTAVYSYLFDEIGVPMTDFDLCLDFNRFDFVIKKINNEGRLCLIKEVV